MRRHLRHVALCAPMILVAAVLLVTGSALRTLIPLAGCMLMMALAIGALGSGPARRGPGGGGGRGTR